MFLKDHIYVTKCFKRFFFTKTQENKDSKSLQCIFVKKMCWSQQNETIFLLKCKSELLNRWSAKLFHKHQLGRGLLEPTLSIEYVIFKLLKVFNLGPDICDHSNIRFLFSVSKDLEIWPKIFLQLWVL